MGTVLILAAWLPLIVAVLLLVVFAVAPNFERAERFFRDAVAEVNRGDADGGGS